MDWIPIKNLGHIKLQIDHENVAEHANRTSLRSKSRQKQIEMEVADKVNQPGKPVKEFFPDVQVCATHEICDYQSSSETAHACKWSS